MRRRSFLGGLGAVVVLGGAGAGGVALLGRDDPADAGADDDAAPAPRETAAVQRTDLVTREDLDGTIGFGTAKELALLAAGTITGLPATGAVLDRGASVAEVDGRPIPLLLGDLPFWRSLGRTMEGKDVALLELNLVALGHGDGLTVDEEFTAATEARLEDWQEALGVEETGLLVHTDVVVRPGPIRVAARLAEIGAPAGAGPLLRITEPDQRVTIALEATRQGVVAVGDAVVVTLPDGTEAPAKVSELGTEVTPGDEQAGTDPTVEVVVALDDPALGAGLDEAPVEVSIVSSQATDVLAVPVQALLALAEGGYAVELVQGRGTTLVAVELGAEADGLVEVTGDVSEGDQVVVPS